jgi:hypothetical protein
MQREGERESECNFADRASEKKRDEEINIK